jgi:plastocyanin
MIQSSTKSVRALAATLAIAALLSGAAVAQDAKEPDQPKAQDAAKQDAPKQEAKKEESKVATVEVTPAQATAEVGGKVQFKAVGKDANGNVLPDAVKFWYAAPMDIAGAELSGLVSVFLPGEVIVGASIGGKVGYAHILVGKPHIAKIELAAPSAELSAGDVAQLFATPRNSTGDPRSDISLAWSSDAQAVATVDPAGMVHAVKPGKATIRVAGDGQTAAATVIVGKNQVKSVSISPANASAKTGDVIRFAAEKSTSHGITKGGVTWSVEGAGAQIWSDGAFVAEHPGTYIVHASAGGRSTSSSVAVSPRDIGREVEIVGHAMPKDEQFAEEWIWDHYAYLSAISDKLYIYDIADPAHPKPSDPLKVDARLINDVSVTPDGKIGVITREGASSRKNGIVFLDTADPMHPKVLSEYTATVTGGVHSAYVNSHYVYLTDDATGSLRVIDFADVKSPKEVARWQVETTSKLEVTFPEGVATFGRYLHDVQVIDGLAYLAYWRDGLVILDVGNGINGGSPEHPQFVSQFRMNYSELYGPGWIAGAHAVYRYKNYVFIGDEVFPSEFSLTSHNRIPVRGIVHVINVSDLASPKQVATYSVPEAGSHNIWIFDDVLYMGYYNGGGRVLDVSGELRGELYNQGREIARFWSGDPAAYRPNVPFAWGAYPYKGNIYVNDVHGGLWIVKLGKHKPYTSTTEEPL